MDDKELPRRPVQPLKKVFELYRAGDMTGGREVQNECCRIICKMCSAAGNMYAAILEPRR